MNPVAYATRTTDGQLATAPAGSSGTLVGLRVYGGTDVDVLVYDGTSTSGELIAALHANAVGEADLDFEEPHMPEFTNGLYVDLSGATPVVEVYCTSTAAPTP